ncbi:MAG: DUF368 domain-containing protein, partial [Elusimicrobia bacterium]|nr:DUF368 domain-containing protein [Elusimicrobiota bacterium]
MNTVLLFLKGTLMGICDIIPGISGGTIAFITGIYEKLINAVKGFSPALLKHLITLNKKELINDMRSIEPGFLITLLLGIATAVLIGSRVVTYLLENHEAYTISFFIGLIIASSTMMFDDIRNHDFKHFAFGILGLSAGISLAFIIPLEISPNLPYTFLGGFLGISAMFLPGISGAFILLIMGLYKFILNALHNPFEYAEYIVIFVMGAMLGAFVISRVISWLFRKFKCRTLYFLLGLVLGALSIPVKIVLSQRLTISET